MGGDGTQLSPPIPHAAISAGSRAAARGVARVGVHGYRAEGPLRLAFAARTSTEDQQDPTLSIPRQLATCRAAIPEHGVIVAHFYDVESGRKDLAARGLGRGHERFAIPVPRDGGIQDLLAEAQQVDRRFDAVICESIDRIARRAYVATVVEHQLENAGVLLLAADEPIILTGRRASQILTRRVKQGVAEWYVVEMLEKAWGGFEAHTDQGYNVGQPPYGYLAHKIPHPVPARRAEGRTKHRLVPDPVRGPVVTRIYAWWVGERLGYKAIAERLNTDPDRYPPPTPTRPDSAVGRWTDVLGARGAHQPEMHRTHGVEPARLQDWLRQSQPAAGVGMVSSTLPRTPRHPGNVSGSPGRRRSPRTVPQHPGSQPRSPRHRP